MTPERDAQEHGTDAQALEAIVPRNGYVLIRREALKSVTRKGLHLPDNLKIPTMRARVLAVPEHDEVLERQNIRLYMKVICLLCRAIPVDLEQSMTEAALFLVPSADIVGVVNIAAQPDGD